MRLFIIAGFACLFTLNSFAVPLSADGLRARQLAHSAANAKFLAKLEKGEAEIDVDKWQKGIQPFEGSRRKGGGQFARAFGCVHGPD